MGTKTTTRVQRPRERPQNYPSDTSVAERDLAATRKYKVVKLNLAGVAQNAFCFTWQNPEANKIIIHEVILRITAAGGTVASVLDVDVVANAGATGNTIYDDVDLNATGVHGSHEVGSGGSELPHVADENGGTNDWVTGKCLAAKCDDLEGAAYIFYTEV